jgi:hypothetical protein
MAHRIFRALCAMSDSDKDLALAGVIAGAFLTYLFLLK